MAKFKYRLQNILDLKYKLEEQQKMNLASARMRLAEEEEKLQTLFMRKSEYEKALREASKDQIKIDVLKILKESQSIIEYYIVEQTTQVERAESVVHFEENKMIEAMKERKIQEKLREKVLEKYQKEENHNENVMIDELVTYQYTTKVEE